MNSDTLSEYVNQPREWDSTFCEGDLASRTDARSGLDKYHIVCS